MPFYQSANRSVYLSVSLSLYLSHPPVCLSALACLSRILPSYSIYLAMH